MISHCTPELLLPSSFAEVCTSTLTKVGPDAPSKKVALDFRSESGHIAKICCFFTWTGSDALLVSSKSRIHSFAFPGSNNEAKSVC